MPGFDEAMSSPHLRRVVREIQLYLVENLHRDINLRTIAREASLSPFYFSRAFTACVGVPPYRYLIGLRIAKAKTAAARDRPQHHSDLRARGIPQPAAFHDDVPATHRDHAHRLPTNARLGSRCAAVQPGNRSTRSPARPSIDAVTRSTNGW